MTTRRARCAAVLTLALGGAALTHATGASAQQVSDADRKAARDLYGQGDSLQKAGKYAEALDAFQRSYTVFPAPTTALHVAQCQASLGHLLEAEEDYRALMNARLAEGAPQAFVQAQEQARIEVAQIAPRVPSLKITTTPAPAQLPGLTVTIDGQPMNAALVGAARPVNPGTHKVVARANGFSPAETVVTVQEKESREVPLALKRASGGVTYQPSSEPTMPATAGATVGAQASYGASPPPSGAVGYGARPPAPAAGPAYATGWNPPYAQRTRRKSPGLYGGGIALSIVGGIVTIVGVGMLSYSRTEEVYSYDTQSYETQTTHPLAGAGAAVTLVGVAGLAGGVAMAVIGGKRVPVTDAKWMPLVRVAPAGATATWTF